MLDLEIGMNSHLTRPFEWDDSRQLDRGKLMSRADLDSGRDFGRYLDVDGDGIPFRTYPGTHPSRGSFFTRGTTRDAYARYTEEGGPYVENMQRLLRKFETAKSYVPAPLLDSAGAGARFGVLHYGSTAAPMDEAIDMLRRQGMQVDVMRVRGFPFSRDVDDFIASHEKIFVVEQNRDAQLRTLLMTEIGASPDKLVSVLHYDGSPVTARYIARAIAELVARAETPAKEGALS